MEETELGKASLFVAGSWFGVKQLTHYNGHSVWREGLLYNNRRANIVRFVAHVGVLYNDRELIQSAKLFFREWIRFGVFPDGVVTEFERWEPSTPNRGWDYAASSIALMIDTADVLARAGEPDLYLYQTSGGRHGTEGELDPHLQRTGRPQGLDATVELPSATSAQVAAMVDRSVSTFGSGGHLRGRGSLAPGAATTGVPGASHQERELGCPGQGK